MTDDQRSTGELVVVTGATGYVGGRLVPRLLEAGYRVRCIARTPEKLDQRRWRSRVEVVAGDLDDADAVRAALTGADRAFYLVHSMGGGRGFAERERSMAELFGRVAGEERLRQIVYLGGLGDDEGELSLHLRSRHDVGRALAAGHTPVTELRAAVILGSGSASFEMLRSLVEVLPVMVVPRWVTRTKCQPVAISDVLTYLVGVLGRDDALDRVLEIGGPDVLTYRDMMVAYAAEAGLRYRLILPVPVLTPSLSAHWVNLTSPLPYDIARPLIDGLAHDVVVGDRPITDLIDHEPLGVSEAIAMTISRVQDLDIPTRWSGASLGRTARNGTTRDRTSAQPSAADPQWAGGTVLNDERDVAVEADPATVMAVVKAIGGTRGWYTFDWLWSVRGAVDKLVGGVGTRRGRRHPDELHAGDAVDFFRVQSVDDTSLLLRAEMRVPGHAWLEWQVEPEDGGTRLHQRARFAPRGLWGRLYWYALLPFHAVIFRRLAARIAELAVERAAVGAAAEPVGPDVSVGDVVPARQPTGTGR